MANDPVKKRALELLWEVYQKLEGDIEKWVLPDEVANKMGIIDPSDYYYNEIYDATIDYLERERALVFAGEPFPKARYYKITVEGRELLRKEGYPVTP
jgi:hypothetical protein